MGDTVLINMPFYTVHAPNLEIGLLKSLLNQSSVETAVKYYNLLYLEETGDYGSYMEIVDSPVEVLYSDWLVSDELVLGKRFAGSEYLEYAKRNGLSDNLSKLHPQMRESLVKFIRQVIESDDLLTYKLLVFSAKYMNLLSSLYLAKLAKDSNPNLRILVFGELVSGMERATKLMELFPFIDLICYEANYRLLREQVLSLLTGHSFFVADGCVLAQKRNSSRAELSTIRMQDIPLDQLPVPDYDDYFEIADSESYEFLLPFETSRGCWWGKCTFCSAKSLQRNHEVKSPGRIVDEMLILSRKYKVLRFDVTDICLPPDVIKPLCERLSSLDCDFDIFWEARADLCKDDLIALFGAGVRTLQVGIESFSSKLLRKIGKGTDQLGNVYFLKSAIEAGIDIVWNLMYGFPEETEEDYEQTISVMQHIVHFTPPANLVKFRAERHSMYHEEGRCTVPAPVYELVLSNENWHTDFADVACYFSILTSKINEEKINELKRVYDEWKSNHSRYRLDYLVGPGFVKIVDKRSPETVEYTLCGWQGETYLMCGHIAYFRKVHDKLKEKFDIEEDSLREFLNFLVGKGLIITEEDQYLGLALRYTSSYDVRE